MLFQVSIFNAVKRHRDPTSENTTTRHSFEGDPTVNLCRFSRLGLSISYVRVMQISAELGSSILKLQNPVTDIIMSKCPPSKRPFQRQCT